MSSERMQRLIDLGCRFHDHQHTLPAGARFERHVKLFGGIDAASQASVGAFTYSWSNISNTIRSVGRYCSIAHSVAFGEFEHPTNLFTTSAIAFDYGMFEEAALGTNYRTHNFVDPEIFSRKIDIGHDVWIGAGAYVRAGVKLGSGCIVGGRSVITKDVPPYAVVVGNPGRIIRYRYNENDVDRLLKSEWWRYKFTDFVGVDFKDINQIIDIVESGKIKIFDENFY